MPPGRVPGCGDSIGIDAELVRMDTHPAQRRFGVGEPLNGSGAVLGEEAVLEGDGHETQG